ncbi:MAG: LCP family protein [Clostridia bacterium]|nr:LCP family protein [Clostridia bacterium]
MKKIAVISLIAVAVIIGAVFAIGHFNDKNIGNETTTVSETEKLSETATSVTVSWNGDEYKTVDNDGLVNILLIGQDRREGEDRQRSDAMILCSFNPETSKLSLISFLRDLYVQIPGYDDNRLNAAYAYGGFELLKETLELNFGISVDGCLESDFEGFEKIIDTIGGVEIELTKEEAEIVGANEGVCTLNGNQALTYARIRKIDSDFQRTERQRKIMNSVFEKAKTYSLTELAMFFSEIFPLMSTDMTDDEVMTLALTLASSFGELETQSYSIPSQGNYENATIRGMAVLVPNLYEIKKLIFEEYLPM